MSKMQVNTSPQEKEKLRKRLQKLFQNQENSEEPAAGKSSKKKRQRKNKQSNNQQIEGQMEQQVTANKLKHNKTNPKNVKKQQQSQKKSPAISDETSKQNGFVKATNPATGKQNLNNSAKQQGSVQKKVKTKEAKFQQKTAALDKKTACESPQTKASPSKQQTKSPNAKTISPKTINKIKKEVTEIFQKKNNKKSSAEIKNKSQPKSQNASVKQQQSENVPKSGQTSTFKQNNCTTNAQTKVNSNQNKKAKKRAASENKSLQETPTTSKKKPKLSKKSNKEKATTSNKKIKTKAKLSNSSSSQLEEDEFAGITGCVPGGDFDSDSEEDDMEHNYWMQEENYSSDDDEDNASDSEVQKFKKNSETGLEQYNHNEASGSEEEYFDSEDEDDEFDEYFDGDDSDEEEEEDEDETYSDFDENDYEEDEDSYNYSMDSDDDDDYSSNYNNMSYDFNEDENDDEYKLPKNIPEDLIIHRGTATKRDLKPDDNISFDSDNEQTQIVELEVQNNVKVVHQPKAYEREELLKLKYEEKTFHKKKPMPATGSSSETEDCPKLVPIVDEDGFQLYNPNEESEEEEQEEMEEEEEEYEDDEEQSDENESMEEYENDDMDDVSLGSEYMELNSDDADSLLSEDINEKYLNRGHDDSESDYSIDEDMWNKKHKVDVIDATGYKCEKKTPDSNKDHSDISLNDDIKQIPSLKLYENVDLKTGSSILSTTIIDKKPFKSIDNIEKELSVKPKEIQETQNNTTQTETWPEEPTKVTEILHQDESMEESVDNQDESLEESLDNQDEAMEESIEKPVQTAKIVKSTTAQSLVDYNTKFFNAFDSNLVAVLLKDPFYIYGTVRLTLLAGKVEVYGHALKLNTEVEIFSPRGCSVIEISPSSVNNKMSKQDLNTTLKSFEKHFALADLKTISDLYNSETDAVVLLKRNEARKKVVQQFKKFMNENVFPNINNINVDRPLYNTEYLLRCMINTSAQEQKCLRLPQQWQQINITPKSRVMLTGGKSVGKSTLLRYLINRHLPQQVLLIDLDIGQPEVFVPQTVSCTIVKQPLLGPGFMLNLQPEISYAVGHTNIALCAHKYIAAVRSLIAHCKAQEEYKDMPWLINTMGYNKGFGLELISVIAQELPLTDVIQLQSRKEIKNFDCILHAHVLSNVPRIMFSLESSADEIVNVKLNYRLHVWQSAVEQESRYQKEWEMSAKDLRFAMLLARLSEALQGHAEWLTDIKPLSASLNNLKIVNLMVNAAEASTEQLAKSVEANLVYLCHHQEDNNPLKCLGIGVVRAVDLHVQQLYLIPAIPYTQLKEINCVAIGEMPLPSSLFTNQGSTVKNTAPFVYNTIAANASKAIKQIYHRPRKFLTGKHKSLN
ncbi:polynucleotide 5'-hydroxyl-kinase NOL9 [Calliphora vicina]|uniref:polynucleotide 5'-hydroxyl-kinase NOL9 n=1 Tax=Calliphora vicina TaxID=7373 RepID=UPI00325BBF25